MKVMMVDSIWYPALNVAAHYELDFAKIKPPKKAEEMMAVAMAIAGMQELHRKPYWIQGIPDTEQSPDVRTMCCDSSVGGAAPQCYQQDVEIVSYTEYSANETLASFVAKTKLAKDSAYDELTTILVNVQASVRLPSSKEWTDVLGATEKKNPVLVLGRINPDRHEYRLVVVHPVVEGAIDYHAPTLLRKQGYAKVAKWVRGTKANQVEIDDERHCPFEKFSVRCEVL